MDRTVGIMAAAALWAVSITLMVVADQVASDHLQTGIIGWGLLAGLAATVVTGWQLIERSRGKVMDYLAHQDLRMVSAIHEAVRQDSRPPTPIR